MLFICISQSMNFKVIIWIIVLKPVKFDLLVGIFINTVFPQAPERATK